MNAPFMYVRMPSALPSKSNSSPTGRPSVTRKTHREEGGSSQQILSGLLKKHYHVRQTRSSTSASKILVAEGGAASDSEARMHQPTET